MADNGVRPSIAIGVVVFLASLFLLLRMLQPGARQQPVVTTAATPEAPPVRSDDGGSATQVGRRAERAASVPAAEQAVPYIEGLVYGDLDLREAKELMPDNLYWTYGSPTKDPKVLEERDAEKRRRNEQYGRVLSGDANEDEVRAYYEYRRRLSSDYLEFAEFMQRRYRDTGSDEFRGMLDLAVRMNADKLASLPAEEENALARSRERAKIRDDWRREQEEFRAAGAPPPPSDGDAPQ